MRNLSLWYTFLDDKQLHRYIDLQRGSSDSFRRILVWFIYYMSLEQKLTESQVNTVLQAFQHVLRLDGFSLDVFNDSSVRLARAAGREDPREKHQVPGGCPVQHWTHRRFMTYCGIALGFLFMLRVSEYCLEGQGYHALRAEEVVALLSDGGALRVWDIA